MSKKGCIIVISGPSGVGKGTLIEKYLDEHKDCYLSISATTRQPRVGEENGVSYHFVTKDEFMNLIARGQMLEYNKYGDSFYGTPKAPLYEAIENGKVAIVEIDVHGFMQIRNTNTDIFSIFISPPSIEQLRERLLMRGSETPEQIEDRIKLAEYEQTYIKHYSTTIVNDSLDDAYKALCDKIEEKLNSLSHA